VEERGGHATNAGHGRNRSRLSYVAYSLKANERVLTSQTTRRDLRRALRPLRVRQITSADAGGGSLAAATFPHHPLYGLCLWYVSDIQRRFALLLRPYQRTTRTYHSRDVRAIDPLFEHGAGFACRRQFIGLRSRIPLTAAFRTPPTVRLHLYSPPRRAPTGGTRIVPVCISYLNCWTLLRTGVERSDYI